jgi:hypothetical protein
MGHDLAQIQTKRDPVWIQGALLAEGLARVMPTDSNPELLDQMYAAESQAREDQKGLWAEDSVWQLYTPENAQEGLGHYQVVEGTVLKTATVNNNIYLNFGQDWRKDFTVMVTPALRRDLSKKGIDPMSLSGKKIRARGWLREYNGPFIELDNALSLEYPLPTVEESPNINSQTLKN